MNTFLPFASFEETAKVLDNARLNSGINEALVLIKSLTGYYELNKRGESGWEGHTIAKFWKGYELQLARFGCALANEFLQRAINIKSADILTAKKTRLRLWQSLVEEMEDRNFPDDKPNLLGDEEFHSAFRSWLLFKGVQAETYKKWKRGDYPDHAVTRFLLPRKSSWKREQYIAIWDFFGRPESFWYNKFGWKEEPDDTKVFYSEDRISQIEKEKQRKKDRPFVPYLNKNGV